MARSYRVQLCVLYKNCVNESKLFVIVQYECQPAQDQAGHLPILSWSSLPIRRSTKPHSCLFYLDLFLLYDYEPTFCPFGNREVITKSLRMPKFRGDLLPLSFLFVIFHSSLGILISVMQNLAPSLMQSYHLKCNSEPKHISPFIHHDAGPSSSPNIHLSSSKLSTLLCSFCVSNWCKAARQSAAFSQSCFVLCDGHPHEGHVSFCAGACTSRPCSSDKVRCLLWL